jgi:hypothetical protein
VTAFCVLSGPLPDERRSELIFRGDLLVFKDVPALGELCALVDSLIPSAPGELAASVDDVQRRFRADSRTEQCLRAALEQVGVDTTASCWDRFHLRVQLPSSGTGRAETGTLGVHRDTWASNVYQQVNWWMPLRPITADRTIALYPAYWETPLANTSAHWDLDEIRTRRNAGVPDVPLVPEPSELVDISSEVRIVIEPGDLLSFSGAHLHASVPNSTAEPRLSVEVRTVNVDDVKLGRGAPNLDGAAPRVPIGWFRRMSDGTSLATLIGEADAGASSAEGCASHAEPRLPPDDRDGAA